MGNSNSAGHTRAASHGDGGKGRRDPVAREARRYARTTPNTPANPVDKHHKHQGSRSKSQCTFTSVRRKTSGDVACSASSIPVLRSASVEVAQRLNASVLSEKALMLRGDSGTSNDSLAEGMRAAEELSDGTFDTFSSCPLVGPRNITTQFEHDSEALQPGSCVFGGATIECEDALRRQSSSTAELVRQESFEGRMSHSIAIVEDWFAAQEKDAPVAA